MGLTGAGFVGTLMVVALAAVTACVWLLPRYSGAGRAQVAARTGLLAGGQAVLLLALLVLINSGMQFYSSWRDLFGMNTGTVRVSDQRPGPVPVAAPSVKPSRDALTRRLPAADGRLDTLRVRGARSGISARVYVYVPPRYASDRQRRFPAVLLLDSPRDAIVRRRVPALAAAEIAAGRLRPMLIVIAPVGAGCVDAPGRAQGETFFGQDLLATVGAAYRVSGAASGWSVAGVQGPAAYCAALLAMRHSDRFGSAVFTAAALTPPAGDLYGGSRTIRDEYDPRWRLRHRPPPPISVGVVGDDGFAAGVRPPMRADPLPPAAWQSPPTVLRWLGAHLASGSTS
ncbi:alpha/beta hydrolase-fold protein [Actinoallomurus iriomotensis]|uniref:Esterase n=1 Tax=Actinoallomurus iriomotensis TaxID=478107 RepID=A0A9W6RGK3_9ACTN|nr:alpha/beta hydrolase-fold protein [Actinoallomurus iriomotensis]GLY75706.1 esterase [Actinoallomurus iriomotensis]